MDMLRSIGKSCEEKEEGKDLLKRNVLSPEWKSEGVMDDESGDSIEDEVPVIQTGELESGRLVWGWRKEAGNWFQRRGEAYWKERSVLFVENMMLVDEPM